MGRQKMGKVHKFVNDVYVCSFYFHITLWSTFLIS